MISIKNLSLKHHAMEYFQRNVGLHSRLNQTLSDRVSHAASAEASFDFSQAEELEHGRNDNRLVSDLYDIFSKCMSGQQVLHVVDLWALQEDLDSEQVVAEFLPSTVYEIGEKGKFDTNAIHAGLDRCNSFVTVWFAAKQRWHITAVAISAFDQEGCIAWR